MPAPRPAQQRWRPAEPDFDYQGRAETAEALSKLGYTVPEIASTSAYPTGPSNATSRSSEKPSDWASNHPRNGREDGRGDIAITGLIRPGGDKNGIPPATKKFSRKLENSRPKSRIPARRPAPESTAAESLRKPSDHRRRPPAAGQRRKIARRAPVGVSGVRKGILLQKRQRAAERLQRKDLGTSETTARCSRGSEDVSGQHLPVVRRYRPQCRRCCRARPGRRGRRGAGPRSSRRLPDRLGQGGPRAHNHVHGIAGTTERSCSATDEMGPWRFDGHSSSPAAACGQPEQRSSSSSLPSDSEDASASAPRSHTAPNFRASRPRTALQIPDAENATGRAGGRLRGSSAHSGNAASADRRPRREPQSTARSEKPGRDRRHIPERTGHRRPDRHAAPLLARNPAHGGATQSDRVRHRHPRPRRPPPPRRMPAPPRPRGHRRPPGGTPSTGRDPRTGWQRDRRRRNPTREHPSERTGDDSAQVQPVEAGRAYTAGAKQPSQRYRVARTQRGAGLRLMQTSQTLGLAGTVSFPKCRKARSGPVSAADWRFPPDVPAR